MSTSKSAFQDDENYEGSNCKDSDSLSSSSSEEEEFGRIEIQIQADFFLRNMCRRIVGVLVQVGLGKCEPQEVHDYLFVEEKEGGTGDNINCNTKTIDKAHDASVIHEWDETQRTRRTQTTKT